MSMIKYYLCRNCNSLTQLYANCCEKRDLLPLSHAIQENWNQIKELNGDLNNFATRLNAFEDSIEDLEDIMTTKYESLLAKVREIEKNIEEKFIKLQEQIAYT